MHPPQTLLLRVLKAEDPPCPVSFFSLMSTAVSLLTLDSCSNALGPSPCQPWAANLILSSSVLGLL